MCGYVLSHGLEKELQVLLAIKMIGNGLLDSDTLSKNKVRRLLRFNSMVTLEKFIKNLEKLNWICIDKKRKLIYVRGFDKIRYEYGFEFRSAVVFKKKDLYSIRGFCTGAFIGSLCNTQLWKERKKMVGSEKWRTFNPSPFPSYFEVSNSSLVQILDISESKVHRLKNKAKAGEYIKLDQPVAKSRIRIEDLKLYRENFPEHGRKLRIINGEVWERLIDNVRSTLPFRKRKSITYDIKN